MNPDELKQEVPVMSFDDNFQNHDWHQEGIELICGSGCGLISTTRATSHATRIKPGLMLVGTKGDWKLVPEGGLQRVKA